MNYAIKINGKEHYKNVTKRLEKLGVKSDNFWNVDKKHFLHDRNCHLRVEDKLYSIFTHDCHPVKLVTIKELENIMKKETVTNKEPIFKKGDRVFTITYGWKSINEFIGNINGFNCYSLDGIDNGVIFHENTLSFTEYTLKGFSQECPIDWKNHIGEWGFFWNHKLDNKTLGVLEQHSFDAWDFFKAKGEIGIYTEYQPLTPELKELLTKEGVING